MARAQKRGRRRFPGISRKTRRRRRGWVTGETIALAEQAHLARIQSGPYHRELRRQTTRALHRDRNAYWKAFAAETERAAACGDTRELYQMLKSASRRPAGVGGVLLERDGSVIPDQARKLCRWVKVSSELAQDRRACSSSVRDVVHSIGDAGSTRPGECRHKYK